MGFLSLFLLFLFALHPTDQCEQSIETAAAPETQGSSIIIRNLKENMKKTTDPIKLPRVFLTGQ